MHLARRHPRHVHRAERAQRRRVVRHRPGLAPCVLFLDELDAIGTKRSLTRHTGLRTTVNQLLTELDGVGSDNEGVYVLAATNHPWDVDPRCAAPAGWTDAAGAASGPTGPRGHPAHPPQGPAGGGHRPQGPRQANGRVRWCGPRPPVRVGRRGCRRLGAVRLGADDPDARLRRCPARDPPSIGPWLETARNVALYANESGEYDELARFLRRATRG
ncbi:MAG: ATP-binding protein [Nocardioides sp.]